jgi:hypothetical protein
LRLRDRRQPPRKLDKLSHRPVRRRTGRRELFLVSLPSRPFAGKLGRQPLEVDLQGGDVRFDLANTRHLAKRASMFEIGTR